MFLIATTLVAIFKHESSGSSNTQHHDGEVELGVFESYAMLWKIMRLPLMPVTIAVLLTSKVQNDNSRY